MNSQSFSPKFQAADNEGGAAAGYAPGPSPQQAASDLRAAVGERAQQFAQSAEEQAHLLKERAIEKAQQFRNLASEKAQYLRESANEKVAQAREMANEQWVGARDKASAAHDSAEDYIRAHPTRSVLGAIGVGFIIGLLVRR
jgi:ElaB/YqjD/DUF883 family membrane-anchored ribosome-binding protein